MAGMPRLVPETSCRGVGKDSGPVARVEALRRLASGPLTPHVVVRGDYGVVPWYGAGGGLHVYHLEPGGWRVILGGGGAPDSQIMIEHGVPAAYLCAFGIFDAKCP